MVSLKLTWHYEGWLPQHIEDCYSTDSVIWCRPNRVVSRLLLTLQIDQTCLCILWTKPCFPEFPCLRNLLHDIDRSRTKMCTNCRPSSLPSLYLHSYQTSGTDRAFALTSFCVVSPSPKTFTVFLFNSAVNLLAIGKLGDQETACT